MLELLESSYKYVEEYPQRYSYIDMNSYIETLCKFRIISWSIRQTMRDITRSKRKFGRHASPAAPYKTDANIPYYCGKSYSYGDMLDYMETLVCFRVISEADFNPMKNKLSDRAPVDLMWGFAKYEL